MGEGLILGRLPVRKLDSGTESTACLRVNLAPNCRLGLPWLGQRRAPAWNGHKRALQTTGDGSIISFILPSSPNPPMLDSARFLVRGCSSSQKTAELAFLSGCMKHKRPAIPRIARRKCSFWGSRLLPVQSSPRCEGVTQSKTSA